MALVETESLILKSYNLAEADKIIVFFTHDHGVIRGVAKGAKRLKSKFGSGLEPFSAVRVTYFQKEVTELVSIQKVELERSYFAAASEPDFLRKFSYLADLLITISPPHDPNETLFRMVRACLEAADDSPAWLDAIGVYFEIWLLRLAGYLPDWSHCETCRRSLDEAETAVLGTSLHLACSQCRRTSGGMQVTGEQRGLRESARLLSPSDFSNRVANSSDIAHLSVILKRTISHAIGREVSGELVVSSYNSR